MITLKQINYALAVAKHLHFKNAAESCSVSQSALSSAISELEKQLGIEIFERDNKHVLITAYGKQFLEKAEKIILQVEDLYRFAQQGNQPLSYPISIGVIPTIGPYLLPKVLPKVRETYPDAQITIIEEQSKVLVDMVRSGEIDAGILALPYLVDGLHTFEFWQEDFYIVSHKSSDMAQLKEIDSERLKQTRLLLLKDGHCLRDHALAACKLSATQSDISLSGASLYTLIQMVAGKMGATMVPEMALSQLVSQNPEVAVSHLDEPGPHRRIAFITRLNYPNVDAIQQLMKLFRGVLKTS